MSDDTSNKFAARGPRKSLNKALRQLNFLKVCSGFIQKVPLPPTPTPGMWETYARQLCSPITLGGPVQQRSYAPAGARWFNPEELTAQKVHCPASCALCSPHQWLVQRCHEQDEHVPASTVC